MTTLYTFQDNLKMIKNLRNNFDIVSDWFHENFMVLNAGKCHFMSLVNNNENETFLLNNNLMGIAMNKKQ